MPKAISSIIFLSLVQLGFCTQLADTLYINTGVFQTFNGSNLAYKAFNASPNFEKNNHILSYSVNDTVSLTIVNNDVVSHQFRCAPLQLLSAEISPGQSVNIEVHSNLPATHVYFDAQDYPTNKNLGLAGMLVFKSSDEASFFWNLKEIDTLWMNEIASGALPSSQYNPKFFLINGNHNPDINTDSQARVVGNVGDTLHIHISNTGSASHSVHFHGYHLLIIHSSEYPLHAGRSKDTFPIHPMQSLTLELVPDQPGEYPVHDHNLVAVTGANLYPNGMFLTMLIAP